MTHTACLNTILSDTYTNYKGRLITRINTYTFQVGKEQFISLQAAKNFIDTPVKLNINKR